MVQYYDVCFNTSDGKSLIKRNVVSERTDGTAWQDACEKVDPEFVQISMNDKTLVSLRRIAIIRIDMKKIDAPDEKRLKREDQFQDAVYTLSNIGL
ncbi:hypothetical protein IV38_GL000052 [Lactobacillus selangorensis]|uniref:Uncharacterized protein n=1 Tax=Lactobacillus selangorensis TaxID=81857 RepID=A0A0R2G3G3_9LACO|nr:hypothetical protein [Lactobacillus selangorensis]KRN29173.1 hypothetical protein IV38_GL000052 [Lactobacillus selangorensis]KRN31469.1 hypothetical protein IV40_GL001466 [Lactobacillus selangorensis]